MRYGKTSHASASAMASVSQSVPPRTAPSRPDRGVTSARKTLKAIARSLSQDIDGLLLRDDFGLRWRHVRPCGLCHFDRQRVALDPTVAAHDCELPLGCRGGPHDRGSIATRNLDGLRLDAVAANCPRLDSGILNDELNRRAGVDADLLGDEISALEQRLDQQMPPH